MEQKLDSTISMTVDALRTSANSLESQRTLVLESQQQMEARVQSSLLSSTVAIQAQASSIEALRHALPEMEARLDASISRTTLVSTSPRSAALLWPSGTPP